MRVLVLANGDLGSLDILRARCEAWNPALVIGADAGARLAALLGLELNIVVGDFDSLQPSQVPTGVEALRQPARKDETDLELALLEAVRRGARQVAVIGALGGRLDMTLANILLLAHDALRGVHVELWNDHQTAWILHPPGGHVSGSQGDTLSLLPIGSEAQGITTYGLEYPLHGETLRVGPARGISNVLTGSEAQIEFEAGLLLAVHTSGRA